MPDHADRCLAFAASLGQLAAEVGDRYGEALPLRVGLHSGPLLAGVIGRSRYAFDIWGDTVNVASRIQGQARPGQLLLSLAARNEIQQYWPMQELGELTLKGYGAQTVLELKTRESGELVCDVAGTVLHRGLCGRGHGHAGPALIERATLSI